MTISHAYVKSNTQTQADSPLVQIQDVNLTLGDPPVSILRNISLELDAGKSLAILGPSGSGKSSLLALMSGLEKPSSGQVTVGKHRFSQMEEDQLALARRGLLGLILQSFHLVPTMTALENVMIPLNIAGLPHARTRSLEELEHVGLSHRLGHYPAQLSGGEQQRVAIARAVVTRPHLLLADEPTGNLDSTTGDKIIDLIMKMHRDRGMTLVVITHDQHLAEKCHRIVTLSDGQIVSDKISGDQKP